MEKTTQCLILLEYFVPQNVVVIWTVRILETFVKISWIKFQSIIDLFTRDLHLVV